MIPQNLVVIESPYAGDIETNVTYAREAMADCIRRGELPFAGHLLYPQPGILREEVQEERQAGIEAHIAWGLRASKAVFYIDRGVSSGMKQAHTRYLQYGVPIEYRSLRGAIPQELMN